MADSDKHWRQLCEQAVREQDPQRLLALVEEINRILGDPQDGEDRPEEKST